MCVTRPQIVTAGADLDENNAFRARANIGAQTKIKIRISVSALKPSRKFRSRRRLKLEVPDVLGCKLLSNITGNLEFEISSITVVNSPES